MKPILAITAAASLALLMGCEGREETAGTEAPEQEQAAAPEGQAGGGMAEQQPSAGGEAAGGGATGGAPSFSQLDTDGDGSISRNEAQAMPQLEQNFQQADRNQDGKVDQSEFAQFETGADTGMAPGGQQAPADTGAAPGTTPLPADGGQTAPGGATQ